jgi:hypothetical protein
MQHELKLKEFKCYFSQVRAKMDWIAEHRGTGEAAVLGNVRISSGGKTGPWLAENEPDQTHRNST